MTLSRRVGLRRVSKKQAAKNREQTKVRQSYEREFEGFCTKCGRATQWAYMACHHKKLRSQGGQNTREDETPICLECHMKSHGLRVVE